jgi:hypothetical protein
MNIDEAFRLRKELKQVIYDVEEDMGPLKRLLEDSELKLQKVDRFIAAYQNLCEHNWTDWEVKNNQLQCRCTICGKFNIKW